MSAELAKAIEYGNISEGKTPWELAHADADFDAFQDDPDFRRLIFPEEFEGEAKAK